MGIKEIACDLAFTGGVTLERNRLARIKKDVLHALKCREREWREYIVATLCWIRGDGDIISGHLAE